MISIRAQNPDERLIKQAATVLQQGGVVILPTDTIYALVADIYHTKALDRIGKIKGVKIEKANFSFLCSDLSNIAAYTKHFNRNIYKLLNRALPGPYTFILEANNEVPSIFRSRKKTIGIRVPDHEIICRIIEIIGHPLLATSLHADNAITEYPTDPNEIEEQFGTVVDLIVDAGYGSNVPSTVIDCTSGEPEVIREGAGSLKVLM